MSKIKKSALILTCAILTIAWIGRGALLEYTDLIDPTESRYATIAQLMTSSGAWLTPSLPMQEGITPYLGKPPLHFWLTAISYSLFGVEEWSARLPSYLAALGIALLTALIARRIGGMDLVQGALLVLTSSLLFFVLAGASVTDVTLSFMVTGGVASIYPFLFADPIRSRRLIMFPLLAASFAAGGFLTKGPVSLVLIALPILLYSGWTRNWEWCRRMPWGWAGSVFLILTVPWFLLSEAANPGFLKYFIWNENIGRYLFKEYGDRYGSGHQRFYGFAWIFLVAAFMPWTVVVFRQLIARGWRTALDDLRTDNVAAFLLCWSLTTPIFFTMVRQLHGMYLLPAIPPLSLLVARLVLTETPSERPSPSRWYLFLSLTGGLSIGLASYLPSPGSAIGASFFVLLSGLLLLHYAVQISTPIGSLLRVATTSLTLYLIVMIGVTPLLNADRSTEDALEFVTSRPLCQGSPGFHTVGLSTYNTFSPYWIAGAWRTELSSKLVVTYVDPQQLSQTPVCHYITKTELDSGATALRFRMIERVGKWFIYERIEAQ